LTASSLSTVGAVLKGIVAGKSVQTLDRSPVGNELAILKVSAVTWGEFRPNECKAMPAGYEPGDCPRAMDGDILISRANTRELVGAPVMVQGNHPNLLLSDKLLKLIPDERLVKREYLVRALRFPAAAQHFAQCAGGTSGSMTNITQENIRQTPIRLPGLPEQRRIAAILDQADALRARRRQALAELDKLAQAVFLEMFGNPVANAKGWPAQRLTEVCHTYSGGTPSKSNASLWEGTVPWFSAKDMKAYDLFDSQDHISETVPQNTSLKLLPPNTVAIVVRGMILAHTFPVCVLRVAATINQDLKALIPKVPLDAQFLANCLRAQAGSVLERVSEAGHGTKRLDAEGLHQISIILPPPNEQADFATRVKAIECLQATHRAALAESDTLFASLQDRAFTGTL